MKTNQIFIVVTLTLIWSACSFGQVTISHGHFRVPTEQHEKALEWYNLVLGGNAAATALGSTASMFQNNYLVVMDDEGFSVTSADSIIDHIGIAVPDIELAIAKALELGGVTRKEIHFSHGGVRTAIVTDPWGTSFELIELVDSPGIDHFHIYVSDASATRDWFLNVFGGDIVNQSSAPSLSAVAYGNVEVHISQVDNGESREPNRFSSISHIGFRIPANSEFQTNLEETGYEPYLVRGVLTRIEGPDGLHLEVTEPFPPRQ